MRRTLVAFIFSLGLSACGGVVEEAPPAQPSEELTHTAQACPSTMPACSSIEGTACTTKETQYCCQDGHWVAKCFCWSINNYKWGCEQ